MFAAAGVRLISRFQFLGIPPKGELKPPCSVRLVQQVGNRFQFLGIPPKGEHHIHPLMIHPAAQALVFPISRDPPEGGTINWHSISATVLRSFQFLGIPPKGELNFRAIWSSFDQDGFQFLGIPPKGEPDVAARPCCRRRLEVSNF